MLRVLKKLNILLTKKQKMRVVILALLILIGGMLESYSVAMIIPLVTVVTDPTAMQSGMLATICQVFHIDTINQLMLLLIGMLIGLYIFKNLYLLAMYYIQYRFIYNCQYTTGKNLLHNYLYRPYEFYLKSDMSVILRIVESDVANVYELLMQCMNLFSEIVVAVALLAVLFLKNPTMTIGVGAILFITTAIIYFVIKPIMKRLGVQVKEKVSVIFKSILTPVNGIKDIKVFHKEKFFLHNYDVNRLEYAKLLRKQSTINAIPKLMIESMCMVSVLTMLGIEIVRGADVNAMLPTLSAFAVAAMRLMPSFNRISGYMNNIAYYEPALNYVYENINPQNMSGKVLDERAVKAEAVSLEDKIEVKDLIFAYPETEKLIFNHADMEVPVGKSVGIVGPSGAGKTTIVDILLGLLEYQGGEILSDGRDIADNYPSWLEKIGYIPQSIYLMDSTIKENIAFGVPVDEIDESRIWTVLEEAQMKEFVEAQPDGLEAMIGERGIRISGGQRQRLGIARALYHNPELLIFDEATSALDNDTEAAIMEAIDSFHGRKTMIIIAHRLKTIENCDIIYEVSDGKINRKTSVNS